MLRLASLLLLLSVSSAAAQPRRLEVTSTAFRNFAAIPASYTCDGGEVAPPLAWSRVPPSTKSIAILVDDPDATVGTFTHWLVIGIPATTTLVTGALPGTAIVVKNDTGMPTYASPCPPAGRHRYQFHVYALDIDTPKAFTRTDFMTAVRGHVVASGTLVGTYQRTKRAP